MSAIKNKFLLFLRALMIFMMLALTVGSPQAARAEVVQAASAVTVPSGLNPGDQYRLIFVTTGIRDATSRNIADYNAFVTAQANAVPALSLLNTTWTAMVNVATVYPYDYVHYIDAMDNTQTNPSVSTGVSIYGLDGLKIADNNADLWDNSIDNRITDENGAVVNKNVWTGQFGTNGPLGCLCGQGQGNPYYTNSIWAAYPTGYSATIALPFYAISGVLTVPLPNAPTALRFAGTTTGSYVSVPDDPDLILTTNFTIEADVKWDGTLGLSTIVSKPRQDAGSPGTGYAVGLIDGQPIIYLSVLATPVNRNLVASTALMPNVWTHLEFAYTGTQELIWVDGTQVASISYPISASVNRVLPTNLLIGREFLLGLTDRAFHGDIDNVRISTGVRPGALTTVAFYPFQEGTGLTTADTSGNAHNGTLSNTNTPIWISDLIAPTSVPTQSPAANGLGWNNTDVSVTWNWTDNAGGSGIDASNCTTSSTSTGEGEITVTATCKDLAGNEGSASYTVMVDQTLPVADAGSDQSIHAGYTVNLDGSASSDDNTLPEELSYNWSFFSTPAGNTATLANADTATPSFTPNVAGEYVAQLIVTDDADNDSEPVFVTLSSLNMAPTGDATATPMLPLLGQTVSLDGTASTDPDNDAISYQWVVTSKPVGSAALLTNATSATASIIPDVSGTYEMTLTVSDFLESGTPVTVSFVASTAAEFSQVQIVSAGTSLTSLSAVQVTTAGNQNALGNFLTSAMSNIQKGKTAQAIADLNKAIERTDGCALRGAPDGNGPGMDWVTTCSAQASIYNSLVAALQALQN